MKESQRPRDRARRCAPPSLARGPLGAGGPGGLPLGACSSVLRRDADDALPLCDAEALEAAPGN